MDHQSLPPPVAVATSQLLAYKLEHYPDIAPLTLPEGVSLPADGGGQQCSLDDVLTRFDQEFVFGSQDLDMLRVRGHQEIPAQG